MLFSRCCRDASSVASTAVNCAVLAYGLLSLHCILIILLYQRPAGVDAGLATCPSPIFGRIGNARSGSCICSFSQQGISLSCSGVDDKILNEMLNAVDQASIESLKIENSNIKRLPASLSAAKNVMRFFRCKNCNLKGSQLPCNLFREFYKLRLIDLSNNPLESVCTSFFTNALEKAEPAEGEEASDEAPSFKINLSNAKLKRIPADMFSGAGVEQLVSLDLSGNKLLTPLTSGVFTQLTGLEEISLAGMGLKEFQASWFKNSEKPATSTDYDNGEPPPVDDGSGGRRRKKRHALTVTTKKSNVTDSFRQGENGEETEAAAEMSLKKLDLSHNLLSTIRKEDMEIFSNSLEALDLSYNKLESLPPKFVAEFYELQTLDLASNRLQTLPVNMFQSAYRLTTLSLAHNHLLKTLPLGLFGSPTLLRELSLADLPKMKTLSEDIFANAPSGETYDLDVIDLKGTRLANKDAVLVQAQAEEGPVEINISINTLR